MKYPPGRPPGTNSLFAGQLAALSRLLEDNVVGAHLKRSTASILNLNDPEGHEAYCTEHFVRTLSRAIVERAGPPRRSLDPTTGTETQTLEVLVLPIDEYERLQVVLIAAARTFEDLAR